MPDRLDDHPSQRRFRERRLGQLLALARTGCRRLMKIQNAALRAWEKGTR